MSIKQMASWLVVVAAATTLIAFWHFLVFHSSDAAPPVFWIYSAGVALALAFAYMLICLPESWSGHWKWRFSLRDVLVVITIVAVVMSAAVYVMSKSMID